MAARATQVLSTKQAQFGTFQLWWAVIGGSDWCYMAPHRLNTFHQGQSILHISLGVDTFPANTERFQGLVPLWPHLCSLSVPNGGGMWGIFGKPLERALWNTRVCMVGGDMPLNKNTTYY